MEAACIAEIHMQKNKNECLRSDNSQSALPDKKPSILKNNIFAENFYSSLADGLKFLQIIDHQEDAYLVKLLGYIDVSYVQDMNILNLIGKNHVPIGQQLFAFCTKCISDRRNQLLKRKWLFNETGLRSDTKRTGNFR
jgi:hypothetical protein